MQSSSPAASPDAKTLRLSLAALGIVYGDIGTSPLYAFRESLFGMHGVAPEPGNVLGILSLIVWSLIAVVSIKYLVFVLRADNHGEGGIVALVALLNPWQARRGSQRYVLMLAGLFGGALLYGDGAITPAISVLSAVEGLKVATPAFEPYVLPITVAILVGLFLIQKKGTAGIGAVFGPIIAIWFVVLAALGLSGIVRHPGVLVAINPALGVGFLLHHGFAGFLVLGGVFLAVTGCEALYADMGHFGRRPIRLAWFVLVFPALLLNYFGQGALVLSVPGTTEPFYQLAPSWAIYPLVGMATMATIIASQAVISGTFSLTRQLVHLGQLPRMTIVQTSSEAYGQIYIPAMNWMLMLVTIALALSFKSSTALAAAYGIAVSTTMVITTILAFYVAQRFDWDQRIAIPLTLGLLAPDLAFFAANLFKLEAGGWFPLAFASVIFVVITTWSRGQQLLTQQLARQAMPVEDLVREIQHNRPHRVRGTAVFLSGGGKTPPYLQRHLERNQVLHVHVVLLTIRSKLVPTLRTEERIEALCLMPGFTLVTANYGFVERPDVAEALRLAQELGVEVDIDRVTFYVGRKTLIPTTKVPGMAIWRERLFAFFSRNETPRTAFYGLPPRDVIELGFEVEI